ncbi:TolC family protein [Akkermansiaceae bacterium]|jgi:NodT family efflux transporter outer membrane factor (OMF) lipoprotein|nr:TolC family protein [bacterium]MDA7880891.1 TolC family protein [Akkermansiaceae bacterium]
MKQASVQWWRQLGDPSLNSDIQSAFSNNPDLKSVALRIDQAEAAVANARAAMLPKLNLGFGYSEGRRQNIDFGPYSLAPWETGGNLSWEIDIAGKLRAAKRASIANTEAAIWDFQSAKLLLSSRIAATRLNLYRFNAEIASLNESLAASRDTLSTLTERNQAGIISNSAVSNQRAENEKLKRLQLDLTRLRDLTIVQLRTLRGGSDAGSSSKASFPSFTLLSSKPLNQVLALHPSLLAAEAKVRAAFELESAARLNLLPSFKFNALASGRSSSLTNRYNTWITTVGPTLDIPIYDPARLAAVKSRKAQMSSAAAEYRKTVLRVLEEIDTANINLRSQQAQLSTVQREVSEIKTTRDYAREQFEAGLTSQIEYLDAERRWLEAKRSAITLQQAALNSRIDLVKATGGSIL